MLIVLITGATAGIGEATAHAFAKHGYDVIITGRREDRLKKVTKDLEKYGHRVLSLSFDVQHRAEVESVIKNLPSDWQAIDVLVNNAGLGLGLGPIQGGDPEDWDTMIDTNVKGLLYMTHAVLPLMHAQKRGHIINLGSIAGKEIYANGNVYIATKHAVDALTKAMRVDLLPEHIRVTGIHPGRVETEFSLVRLKGDAKEAKKVYEGYEPLLPEDIADVILFAATRPAHVTINELTIMPTTQANANILLKE